MFKQALLKFFQYSQMPFTKEDQWNLPLHFQGKNEVIVIVAPSSARIYKNKTIPIDGRQYICGGTIKLKNGMEYRASFTLNTSLRNFLDLDSVYLYIDEIWYQWNEPLLLLKLGIEENEIFPFEWNADRQLQTNSKGPYSVTWPDMVM